MEEEKCKQCDNIYSCRYLQHRFKTKNKKCGYDKRKVKIIHFDELEKRKESEVAGIWKIQ